MNTNLWRTRNNTSYFPLTQEIKGGYPDRVSYFSLYSKGNKGRVQSLFPPFMIHLS